MLDTKDKERINGHKRDKRGSKYEARSTMWSAGQRSITIDRRSDYEQLTSTSRRFELKPDKVVVEARQLEELVKKIQRAKEENIMLNEYFDIFERKYAEKSKAVEMLTKENRFLRKSLEKFSPKQLSPANKKVRDVGRRVSKVKDPESSEKDKHIE